jgi:hypothetical protein
LDLTMNIINPKRPTGPGWVQESMPPGLAAQVAATGGFHTEIWWHGNAGISVISAVEVVKEPGKPELGPEYHISVSANGQRCTPEQAHWTLQQFGLEDAKEDNHVPSGRVRNYWRPVADHLSGYECPCVADEPAVRDDKGSFVWRGVTK